MNEYGKKRMNEYRLTLELQSDLCPGSGFDYAGVIDSDVCADPYGLPYIPARRLKGCFLETARTMFGLEDEEINSLFGKRGDDGAKGFVIKNAYLERSEEYRTALTAAGIKNSEQVLEQFTSVRAQTRLEDGVAEEETLRYTRVIDCKNAVSDGNVKFVSDVFCEEKDSGLLKNIIRATKNIGMHRNRGLGSVRCDLVPVRKESAIPIRNPEQSDEKALCELHFTVRNIDPLEISSNSDDRSLTYINGASVRGCLASNYFRLVNGASPEKFEDIFLSETTFNNLYPSMGEEEFYPAPLYLRRLKKTKDLVDIAADDERRSDGDAGNRPQKLKNTYVKAVLKDGRYTYDTVETKMELAYHHRSPADVQKQNRDADHENQGNADEDQQLYVLETISPGQCFTGSILTPHCNVELFKGLLEQGTLSFGKSKSAQYGRCELVWEDQGAKYDSAPVHDDSGRVMLALASNAVLRRANGEYTTNRDEVTEALRNALVQAVHEAGYSGEGAQLMKEQVKLLKPPVVKITYSSPSRKQPDNRPKTERVITEYLETRMIYGYNTKWNLKRSSVPAVSAGSCVAFTIPAGREIPGEFYVGERQQEGFGHVLVFPYSSMKYACVPDNKKDGTAAEPESGTKAGQEKPQHADISAAGGKLLHAIFLDELQKEILKDAFSNGDIGIGKTALGRVTLMLKESYRTSQGADGVKKELFIENFKERYLSIKTESTKKEVTDFIEKSKKIFGRHIEEFEHAHPLKLSEEEKGELFYRFMLTRLTAGKYAQKNSVQSNNGQKNNNHSNNAWNNTVKGGEHG